MLPSDSQRITESANAFEWPQLAGAIRGSTLNSVTQHQQRELRWSAEIGASIRKAIHTPDQMSEDDVFTSVSDSPSLTTETVREKTVKPTL